MKGKLCKFYISKTFSYDCYLFLQIDTTNKKSKLQQMEGVATLQAQLSTILGGYFNNSPSPYIHI